MPGESRALKTHFKMKVINSYRASARVTEETEDTRAVAEAIAIGHLSQDNLMLINSELSEIYKDLPINYIVRVQIRVLFIWITIWSESCNISDGDTRVIIKDQANYLFNRLEAKI